MGRTLLRPQLFFGPPKGKPSSGKTWPKEGVPEGVQARELIVCETGVARGQRAETVPEAESMAPCTAWEGRAAFHWH